MTEHQLHVSETDALSMRGDGKPDMGRYRRLLAGLGDGQALRVAMGGQDSDDAERANFTQAARDLGLEVGFSKLYEDDNIPYLLVTRNPNYVRPHLPGR